LSNAATVAVLLSVIFWLSLAGCANTVTPDRIAAGAPSWDGNEQTSGVLSLNPNGFVVTDHFRFRYNGLIATYGRDFTPPLKADAGIIAMTSGRWLIDRQHLSQFLEMNAWHRAGLKPQNQKL
jgi:hypothetical protein